MQMTDGAWQFDSNEIDAAVELGEHERGWYQRDMLNAFTRYAYYRYKQIRDQVNKRKCKHMTIDKVRANLEDEQLLNRVCETTGITQEEVAYIIEHADLHLIYIK